MERWRKVWRKGVVPQLTKCALRALKQGLETNDATILQGLTTSPPPLGCMSDYPVEAACVLGYTGWKAERLQTVEQVENFFVSVCLESDQRMGEPASIRHFLNWFDDSPRDVAVPELLAEVTLALAEKEGSAA